MSWVTFSPHFVLVSSYHPVESLFINFPGSFYPQKIKIFCGLFTLLMRKFILS